ncbi:tail protein X [Arvimicrobium flavum]|uniref:tail protein X n=1 Tax=Arvimicrobium flavum TaxID=3393320 RepID=UPI00237BE250|nr:tail protein X [Mesorhizobium shangrilense]
MAEIITIRGEGIMLDLLLWRRYGVRGQGLVERTLELNPGLAELGPVLPIGTVVTIPDLPPTPSRPARRVVSLFG